MEKANLKEELDKLIEKFEQSPDSEGLTEAVEHLKDAKACLGENEGSDPGTEGQPA